MDVVYWLVIAVLLEVAVVSLGLFWYLPRAINQAFIDAEDMIERQRDEIFTQAGLFVKTLFTKENIEALTAVAAPVLSAHIKRAAGGIASGYARRAGGDLLGSLIEGALGHVMGGAGAPPQEGTGGGVAPPK